MLRTVLVVTAVLSAANPAAAQRNPLPDPDAARIAIEQAQRERSLRTVQEQERRLRTVQEQERRLQSARDNCVANRGVDCDSPQGLAEWVQLERSRAEAVLDRIAGPEPAGSASTGSSSR